MSMKRVLGCIKKADNEYDLIKEGDKIAVGISGGKDSLVLFYALNLYKRFAGKNFEVYGVHVKMGFPGFDLTPTLEFFEKEGTPIHVFDNDIYSLLKQHLTNKGQLPCSICSRMKKAAVNQAAKSLGCNKVAFAHHAEDAIETFVMNAMYGGRVATFAPAMHLDNIDIDFIRPMVYARENWISMAAKKVGFPVAESCCPNDKHTQREETKKMLRELYKQYPMAKENFLLMLHNPSKLDLWTPKGEVPYGSSIFVTGKVIKGNKNGRKLGFRTANIAFPEGLTKLTNGVYKTKTYYNGKVYKSMTNIGTHPTIDEYKHQLIETHLFDFDENIYGKDITVEFLSKIRNEVKFNNVEELINQLNKDKKDCE